MHAKHSLNEMWMHPMLLCCRMQPARYEEAVKDRAAAAPLALALEALSDWAAVHSRIEVSGRHMIHCCFALGKGNTGSMIVRKLPMQACTETEPFRSTSTSRFPDAAQMQALE